MGGCPLDMQQTRQEDLGKIKNIKNSQNVAAIGPMLRGGVEVKDRKVLLAGMDFKVSQFLRPWWIVKGAIPEKDGVLLGSEAARVLGLDRGKRIRVNDRELVVSGVLESTGSQDDQIIFTRLDTAQSIMGKEDRISMAEVAALCSGCPIEEMVKQISEILPGANVMAIKQVVQSRMETLDHFRKASYLLSGVVALGGGLVVLVTMMGSVRARPAAF